MGHTTQNKTTTASSRKTGRFEYFCQTLGTQGKVLYLGALFMFLSLTWFL